jgi:hypothetical protein
LFVDNRSLQTGLIVFLDVDVGKWVPNIRGGLFGYVFNVRVPVDGNFKSMNL